MRMPFSRARSCSSFSRRSRMPGCSLTVAPGLLGGINGLGGGDALVEEAQTSVDLPQAPLAIDVIAILRPVAIARGPFHHAHDFRPIDTPQLAALGLQPGQTRRRDVVLRSRRDRRRIIVIFIVGLVAEIVRVHDKVPLSRAKRADSGQYFVIMLQFGGIGSI